MTREYCRLGVVRCGCCGLVLAFWPCAAEREQHGQLLRVLHKLLAARKQQLHGGAGPAAAGGPGPEPEPPLVVVYNDAHLLTAHLTAHPEDRPAGWENVK
jgi:hypothetical protein